MIVKFLETGDQYEVLNLNVEMKDPSTREWIKAVSYKRYKTLNHETGELELPGDDIKDKVFVREFNDFRRKFESCLDF